MLDTDLELAVALVSDVVLNGSCAAADVDLERDVVLEELAMRDDDPEDALGDVFLSTLFGDHPIGRPVIGNVESVSSMTRAQLRSFHQRRYTPERMVVAVAGNIDHSTVVALVREHFGHRLVRGREPVARGAVPREYRVFPALPWSTAMPTRPICLWGTRSRTQLAAPPGAGGAQHRSGRWTQFPAVPTGPGDPRAGLLDLLVGGHVCRCRSTVGLYRVPT